LLAYRFLPRFTDDAITNGRTLSISKGRYYLSKGYLECEGDSSKRYKYAFAKFVWYGLLGNIALGTTSCVLVMCGKKKL